MIVRNGYLIWKGPDSDACHEIYSATKVFTSTVLGVLIGDGKCTLETLAVEHLPELDDAFPAYAKIKLRHLASMTGGYKGQVANLTAEQPWGDPIDYVTTPAAPAFEPSGSQIDYNDHDVHPLGRVLARIAGEPLQLVFHRRIAEPIGMRRWEWGVNGTLDGMLHHNAAGTPTLQGNGGIQTTPLELARLGLLYLNRGKWDGVPLLPESFVDAAGATGGRADGHGARQGRGGGLEHLSGQAGRQSMKRGHGGIRRAVVQLEPVREDHEVCSQLAGLRTRHSAGQQCSGGRGAVASEAARSAWVFSSQSKWLSI